MDEFKKQFAPFSTAGSTGRYDGAGGQDSLILLMQVGKGVSFRDQIGTVHRSIPIRFCNFRTVHANFPTLANCSFIEAIYNTPC